MPHLRSSRGCAILGVLAASVITFSLVGCGASGSNTNGSSAAKVANGQAPAQPQEAAPVAEGGAAAGAAAGGAAGDAAAKVPDGQPYQGPAQDPVADGLTTRSIVYTATITVRVSKVDDAAGSAAALATGAHGIIAADQRQRNGDRSEARLVLRVPAEQFASTMDALHRLGNEESRSVDNQDVTAQLVDLEVRVANGQASVDRVRTLMAKAQTIADIVSLESELSRREADLESLKARKNKLDDLTALSTITAVLLGPDAKPPSKPSSSTGFLAGLKAGWHAFTASMRVLLTVLGALLPWLILLAIPIGLVVWLVRRPRRPNPLPLPLPTPEPTPEP